MVSFVALLQNFRSPLWRLKLILPMHFSPQYKRIASLSRCAITQWIWHGSAEGRTNALCEISETIYCHWISMLMGVRALWPLRDTILYPTLLPRKTWCKGTRALDTGRSLKWMKNSFERPEWVAWTYLEYCPLMRYVQGSSRRYKRWQQP